MDDTPVHIKKIQHDIWMSKTPTERIEQFLQENEIWFLEMKKIKVRREEEEKIMPLENNV